MLKTFTTVLLATVFSASLIGCSNVKKADACCPDCEKENNGKSVVTNQAKPSPTPTTNPTR